MADVYLKFKLRVEADNFEMQACI